MDWDWTTVFAWANVPLITVGKTPVTIAGIFGLFVILGFVWWFSALVERTLRRVAMHGRAPQTSSTVYAFTRLIRYVVWILGTVIGLTYLGFDLTNLAIIGGAIGVGIGFGLQNIFSNFISGIIILVEKTLKIGDYVEVESGVRGTVTEIAMRYTRVNTNDNVDVLVPNSEFINKTVRNWTFGERNRRIRVKFGVAYGTNKELVREAAIAAAEQVQGLMVDERHPVDVRLKDFGESSLDFELLVWAGPESVGRPGGTSSRLRWALETELTQRGIEIPFPQRDLHVRSGTIAVKTPEEPSEPSDGRLSGTVNARMSEIPGRSPTTEDQRS
ncbi:MAG TPA: mechanosensitive ion channel domain-containing protein [Burkholderiales bacterium]|nr:mechanosensitive ion channel domain-containing protein [Burkholderiales bacterium]